MDAPQTARMLQIPDAVSDLQNAIEVLTNTVDELESRLLPIMSAEQATPSMESTGQNPEAKSTNAPHYDGLVVIRDRLKRQTSRIKTMIIRSNTK